MSFSYYSPFTTDPTKCGSADSSNFPLLINVTDARFKSTGNGGHVANTSGFDIRPYSDTAHTSALTYQLKFYDPVNGVVVMRVLTSTLSHTAAVNTYLFYGDAALNTDGSSTSAWNSNYKGVWPFGDGTTLNLNDASASGFNGTNHSATAAAGQVDGAAAFVGASSQYIDATGYTASTNFASKTFTIEALFKTSTGGVQTVISKGGDATAASGWVVFVNSGKITVNFRYSGGQSYIRNSVNTYNDGNWHHLLVVMTTDTTVAANNTATIYVDGTADNAAQTQVTVYVGGASSVQFGRTPGAINFMTGSLGEVKVWAATQTADWAVQAWNNELHPTTFNPVGAEVNLGGAGLALRVISNSQKG